MSEAFVVRAATLGDYDGMCTLLAAVDELHRVNVPWMFRKPTTEPRSKDYFQQLLHSEDSTVLVAEARVPGPFGLENSQGGGEAGRFGGV